MKNKLKKNSKLNLTNKNLESSSLDDKTIGNKPSITNIVSTSNLGCTLNIKVIALKVKNQIVKYNKIRNEVILQLKNPKTIFRS